MKSGKTYQDHGGADPPCKHCMLAAQCPAAMAGALDPRRPFAIARSFKRGTRLQREGERPAGLLFIKSGLLGIRQTGMDGIERAIAVIGPGFLIGQPAAHRQTAVLTAQALTAVSVCELPPPMMQALMQQSSEEGLRMAHYTRQSVISLTAWSQVVRMPGLLLRMASALRILAAFQAPSSIQLPSQVMLAELLCVTRESVNRAWKDLELRGIVRRRHANAVDLDLPALEKMLTGDN